jgi:hypothetical protein
MGGSAGKPARVLANVLGACDDALGLLDSGADALAPSVSGWSVLQHLEHVALTNRAIARAVRTIESGRGEPGARPGAFGERVLQSGRIPRGRARHPEIAAPKARPVREDVRVQLEESRGELEVFGPQMDDLAAREETVAHFALGAFRAVEWIRFADVHTRHHLRIARRILKAAQRP